MVVVRGGEIALMQAEGSPQGRREVLWPSLKEAGLGLRTLATTLEMRFPSQVQWKPLKGFTHRNGLPKPQGWLLGYAGQTGGPVSGKVTLFDHRGGGCSRQDGSFFGVFWSETSSSWRWT